MSKSRKSRLALLSFGWRRGAPHDQPRGGARKIASVGVDDDINSEQGIFVVVDCTVTRTLHPTTRTPTHTPLLRCAASPPHAATPGRRQWHQHNKHPHTHAHAPFPSRDAFSRPSGHSLGGNTTSCQDIYTRPTTLFSSSRLFIMPKSPSTAAQPASPASAKPSRLPVARRPSMPHQRSSSSSVEPKSEASTPTPTPTASTLRRPPPTRIPSYAPSAPGTPLQSAPPSLRSSGSVSPSKPEPKAPTSVPPKSLPPKVPVSTPVKKCAPPSPVKESPPSTPKPPRVFTKEEAVIHPLDTSVLSAEKIPDPPSPLKTTAPSSPTKGPRSPLSPAALAPPALSPPHTPGSSIELDVLGEKRFSLVSEVLVEEDPKFKDKATQTPTRKSDGDEDLGELDARDTSILTFFAEQGAHPPETRNPTPAVTPRSSTTFADFVAIDADPVSAPTAPVTPSGKNNASLSVISNMWRGMRRSLSTSGGAPSVKGSPPRSSKEDPETETLAASDAPSTPDPTTPAEDANASTTIPEETDRTPTPYSPSDRFGELAELLGPHFEGKTNSDQRHLKAARALDELLSLAHPSTISAVMDDMHRRARP